MLFLSLMGAFAKLLNGFGTPTTYIVITYYNVKQKDLNFLNNFQTGIHPSSLPGPAHFTIQDSGTNG